MTRAGIGHTTGPMREGGESWRRTAWARARADLMPTLPIEAAQPGTDAALSAPRFAEARGAVRDRIGAAARSRGAVPDRFLVVGETAFERDWAEAGRTAEFVNGAPLFG